MSSIYQNLAAALGQVRRPGDFYAIGTLEIHPPRLEVEGIGPVALPLLPVQAEQIIAIAERAPYGRGTATLVDTDVRRTWQLGAERVRISGKAWEQGLAGMVAQAAAGLGVTGPVDAELYKLLVDAPHRLCDRGRLGDPHPRAHRRARKAAAALAGARSANRGGEL